MDTVSMQPLAQGNIRLAATLVLLREHSNGYQVYMVERPGGAVFPNLHVFPGGKVDAADDEPSCCDGLDSAGADALLGMGGGLRYWVTAIRECFEECGILMLRQAGSPDGAAIDTQDRTLLTQAHQLSLAPYRQRLIDGQVSITQMCADEGLVLACDELHYFSHWLTPEVAPKRFDTRFFVARVPAEQRTDAHAYEVVDDSWVTPRIALERAEHGDWQLIAPTRITLQTLSEYSDIDSLLVAVEQRRHLPLLSDDLRKEGMCEL